MTIARQKLLSYDKKDKDAWSDAIKIIQGINIGFQF